ncbi:MAG TPA: HAMP domain-containing sensor histidine kinase [Candidatus Paceibacterota bacterium]|nr:HAMP domain-containing sensor histidine kinase [Candidatus Paceibacterota bacterium]
MNNILDICAQALGDNWQSFHTLAYYSHLIPVFLSLALSLLLIIKAKRNVLAKIFILFTVIFSIWLIGDLITWTSKNYYLIYATWSLLDYLEIVFYVLGLYFATVFVKKSDISILWKIALFALTIPAFIITIGLQSVTGFNYPVCEAFNSDFLGQFKLVVEGIMLVIILIYIIVPFFKKSTYKKKANLIVLGSMFLFLSVFGVTEYLASVTGYYEMNLYSLFLLPVFLVAIIYSVFELDIFHFRILSTYYLVIGLIVLMGGQLFFITSTTNKLLTALTIVMLAMLSVILFRNLKRESDQRLYIEKLSVELKNINLKLQAFDTLKSKFLSLASHQLRNPISAIINCTSLFLDGSFGKIDEVQKKMLSQMYERAQDMNDDVERYLTLAKVDQGGLLYVLEKLDLEDVARSLTARQELAVDQRNLTISFETDGKTPYFVYGDRVQLKQVVQNLIDNSMKYTKKGWIKVKLSKDETAKKIRVAISDSGMGIPPEIMPTLFKEFARGEGAKMDVKGSGIGIYLAKEIIEKGHHGRIWAESEGADKGSTFTFELPIFSEDMILITPAKAIVASAGV